MGYSEEHQRTTMRAHDDNPNAKSGGDDHTDYPPGPVSWVDRPCTNTAADVLGGSESDPFRTPTQQGYRDKSSLREERF